MNLGQFHLLSIYKQKNGSFFSLYSFAAPLLSSFLKIEVITIWIHKILIGIFFSFDSIRPTNLRIIYYIKETKTNTYTVK